MKVEWIISRVCVCDLGGGVRREEIIVLNHLTIFFFCLICELAFPASSVAKMLRHSTVLALERVKAAIFFSPRVALKSRGHAILL